MRRFLAFAPRGGYGAGATLALAAVNGARCGATDAGGDGSGGNELLGSDKPGPGLRGWKMNETLSRLNRQDPGGLAQRRHVVAVVGITGGGKSSTCNTMAGRSHKQFRLSNSLTSVTSTASYLDYQFGDEEWRVIDTPGLFDTNRPDDDIQGEVARIASYAPHGVTAFVFVVPRGRFTAEHERALRELVTLFGPEVKAHCVVAITSATDPGNDRQLLTRDALLDEVNALPLNHFFRNFVADVGLRVVAVENRVDPHRQISRFLLHQRVLDVLDGNGGRTYNCAHLGQATTVKRADG